MGINSDGNYSMIICKKDEMNSYINNFPKLNFEHIDYNYTFYMTYKDLFLKIDNYYYFLIIFLNNQIAHKDIYDWYLGLPFLNQYQFALKMDTYANEYTIGFYKFRKEEEKEKQPEKEKENFLIWIFILLAILIALLILISVLLIFYVKKHRKKKAIKLNDDYDYSPEISNKDNVLLNE